MKILTVVEFSPATNVRKRSAFTSAMIERGFIRLTGVSSCWVADRKFASVELARQALAQAAADSTATVHKAYLVEYSDFAAFPPGLGRVSSIRTGAPMDGGKKPSG